MARFRVTCPDDKAIETLAANMRQSDRDEMEAMGHTDALEVVRRSVQCSDANFSWAAYSGDKLLFIAGCSRFKDAPGVGVPWLLGTDELKHFTKTLTQVCKIEIKNMLNRYAVLMNVIDVRNVMTIRWLQSLGFEFKETLEINPGFPIIRFEVKDV